MLVIYQKENQEIIIIKDRLIGYLKVGGDCDQKANVGKILELW